MTNPLALIIEDDAKLSIIFSIALEEAEFETEIVSDGKLALVRLAEIVPNVVVLDLHLPQISGAEVLRQIRTDNRLKNTRIMLATADAILAEELHQEVDIVLLKPISVSQLCELAARLRPPDTILD